MPAHITDTPLNVPLANFIEDFDSRVSALGWWTDALLVIATTPAPDWTALTAHWRVYLTGPQANAVDAVPDEFLACHMSTGTVWATAFEPGEWIDRSLFGSACSQTRRPGLEGHTKNLLLAHIQRQPDNRVAVGYQWTHDPQTIKDGNSPELDARLDDTDWVRQQIQTQIPGPLQLP